MMVRRLRKMLLALPVFAIAGPVTAQDSQLVQIDTEKILAELATTRAPFECEDRCVHEPLGIWQVRTGKDVYKVLVIATDDSSFGGCHACGKTLSFFAFRNEVGIWREKWRHLAAITRGTWGEFDRNQISLNAISSKDYAIFIESSFLGQGTSVTTLELFSGKTGKLERLLNACIAADNSGVYDKGDAEYYNWQAQYSLVKNGREPFDLKFDLENKTNGRRTVSHFRFGNGKYEPENADSRLRDPSSGCNPE